MRATGVVVLGVGRLAGAVVRLADAAVKSRTVRYGPVLAAAEVLLVLHDVSHQISAERLIRLTEEEPASDA
ncbi:hypothetical protein WJX75_003068 [Coccomyxa subellipsoidea]|uniref:Secreted protein n=1 Tax=Coccomyxa subellipsoidea TaxID=248742 RepID=A0ABR2YAI3_9CHLO